MLCLVRTKACKRCGGDLSLERDTYGTYLECIQCGANWSEQDLTNSSKTAKQLALGGARTTRDYRYKY